MLYSFEPWLSVCPSTLTKVFGYCFKTSAIRFISDISPGLISVELVSNVTSPLKVTASRFPSLETVAASDVSHSSAHVLFLVVHHFSYSSAPEASNRSPYCRPDQGCFGIVACNLPHHRAGSGASGCTIHAAFFGFRHILGCGASRQKQNAEKKLKHYFC